MALTTCGSESETTIYERAVEFDVPNDHRGEDKRISTSSEEYQGNLETVDRPMEVDQSHDHIECSDAYAFQIVDKVRERERREFSVSPRRGTTKNGNNYRQEDGQLPFTSRGRELPPPLAKIAEDKARDMIRKAEASKARMLEVPGKDCNTFDSLCNERISTSDLFHLVIVDEQYTLVGCHIDMNMK